MNSRCRLKLHQGTLIATAIKKNLRRFNRINDFSSTDMINEIDLVKTIDVFGHRLLSIMDLYGLVIVDV